MIGTDLLVDWLFQAYERRFPTCPMIPVFLGSDTVMEYKSEDGAVHIIERRCRLNVEAPYLLKKIIGVDFVYFIQKNSLDRRARVLKIDAHNESFSSRVGINENCTYSVHPENPEWTCFEQSASLDVKSFFGFENAVEKLAMKQYSQNISKGKEIIEYYINELHKEGITYLPPFQEKDGSGDADRPAVEAVAVRRRSAGEKAAPPSAAAAAEAPSAQDANLKLESEYIERCLGALTPYQESCLVMLQKWIANAHQGKVPSDQTLVRFLQAQDFNLEKAREMLCQSLVWRKKYQVDRILSTYDLPQVVKDSWTCLLDLEGLNMRHLWRPGMRALLHIIEMMEANYPETMGRCLVVRAPRVFPILWALVGTFINDNTRAKFTFFADGNHTPTGLAEFLDPAHVPDFLGGPCQVPSDQTLVRFLQAQDFNLEKAREMLCQSLVWRKKYQVDRILSTYDLPQVVKEYFPGGWHHHDKDGRPMYILRLGQVDMKGFIKSIGEQGLVKLTLHLCEEGLKRTEEATLKTGKPISSWTCLLDLEGLNMRHLWRPGMRALLHIIEMMEANYPETMGRCLVVRAPRVFPILWALVGTFINDNTRAKFTFFADGNHTPTGLAEFLDPAHVPDFLGGPCQTSIPDGGLIPKNLYMSEEDYEREKADGMHLFDDTMYHSVSLARGQVHEVVLNVSDQGSVICWDFDIMKEDVVFAVHHTTRELPPPEASEGEGDGEGEEPVGCAHSPLPLAMLTLDTPPSLLPKTWVAGVDYRTVEPPITCHDGESVQGSHVTSTAGTYILQWRHLEGPQHHSFEFPLAPHKAKVMYYYELLKGHDYRGGWDNDNNHLFWCALETVAFCTLTLLSRSVLPFLSQIG
ncbi:conserved hypothetical protein [Ixodes scapularis]|uniref:Phosphatidylinositol transfer protein sec14 n=1 Tax=Ixodes scapularis TaxID=6945 RepID=B7PYS3_IXOSC|nr:conserved hypothetical protein [Ixodes scapularis]|eukprot:XP_002403809.1 conserved hypothetical protein [Ixodes scapularis]